MSHCCPVHGCAAVVDDAKLMCPADWYRVPRAIRAAVNRAYANGWGLGSVQLLHAQQAAIRAVNRAGGPS